MRNHQYGRIFNRVDNQPVELQLGPWRIGFPTMLAGFACLTVGLIVTMLTQSMAAFLTTMIILAIPLGVASAVLNAADPDKAFSEPTVVRLILTAIQSRGCDTLHD